MNMSDIYIEIFIIFDIYSHACAYAIYLTHKHTHTHTHTYTHQHTHTTCYIPSYLDSSP